MSFSNSILDAILTLQLTVARLGEKDLMNWWNLDVAQELGGADFLTRLVGPTHAPLAVADALLTVAAAKEQALISKIPGQSAYTLFFPNIALLGGLRDRFRHYKRYHEDIPSSVIGILDPRTAFTCEGLLGKLAQPTPCPFQGTSFGREITVEPGWDELRTAQSLTSLFTLADKGSYPLAYFKSKAVNGG